MRLEEEIRIAWCEAAKSARGKDHLSYLDVWRGKRCGTLWFRLGGRVESVGCGGCGGVVPGVIR